MADVLRSGLLAGCGVAHGFNLRTGGASLGPYASLNLGRAVGDEPAHVLENHRRVAAAIGYPPERLFETSQVHGAAVCEPTAAADVASVRAIEADALVAGPGGIALAVRTADCVPLLICDTASGAVAAIHAGWRGVVRGVVEAGLAALRARAPSPSPVSALRAALFPHIGACCFEVGDDVAAELLALCPEQPQVVDRRLAKPHVDLAAIIGFKLARAGLQPEQIDRVGGCTRCEPERFFSFRRDGQRSGRHAAVIVSA